MEAHLDRMITSFLTRELSVIQNGELRIHNLRLYLPVLISGIVNVNLFGYCYSRCSLHLLNNHHLWNHVDDGFDPSYICQGIVH